VPVHHDEAPSVPDPAARVDTGARLPPPGSTPPLSSSGKPIPPPPGPPVSDSGRRIPHLRAQPVVETRLLQVKLRAVPAALLQREDGHRWVAVRDSRFQEQVRGPVVALADVPVVAPADAGRLVARVADVAVAKNSSRWACRATRQTTQRSRR
jgi:hypothetical protein